MRVRVNLIDRSGLSVGMDVVLGAVTQTASVGEEASVDGAIGDFDMFYRRTFAGMVVLATAVTGQRAGAEDIVQDAMLDAHRRWDRIGGYDAPRAWVRRVVIQRSTKVSRKRRNERHAHLRAVGDARPGSGSDGLDPALADALRSLPVQQRAVLALHYLEDVSVHDTADLLGIAEGTVKTHLSRGRSALAARLAGPTHEPPIDPVAGSSDHQEDPA